MFYEFPPAPRLSGHTLATIVYIGYLRLPHNVEEILRLLNPQKWVVGILQGLTTHHSQNGRRMIAFDGGTMLIVLADVQLARLHRCKDISVCLSDRSYYEHWLPSLDF